MGEKLIFRKLGKGGYKEIDSDDLLKDVVKVSIYSECFKLHRVKGRPKKIFHEWMFEIVCQNEHVDFKKIMGYTEETRKEILGEFYGKEYLEKESWKKLYKEIELKKIPTPYGN